MSNSKKRVLIRGPVLSASGYGHHARFVYNSLKDREDVELFLLVTNWGKSSWLAEDDEWRKEVDMLVARTAYYIEQKGAFDISVQVTIPGEWEKLAPYNIGVTAGMETETVSRQWVEKTYSVEKIVVTSEHAKNSFVNARYPVKIAPDKTVVRTINPNAEIVVVHYPALPVEVPESFDLGLPLKYDRSYLAVLQWGPRKNLEQTITGFVEEMKDKPVNLILKISGVNDSGVDCANTKERLDNFMNGLYARFPDRKLAVYLIHGRLSEVEMAALYTHPTMRAMLSLTHGEGFGLPLFEAAYCGLPIACPMWSGHVDFLCAPAVDKQLHKTVMKPMVTEIEYEIKSVGDEFKNPQWKNIIEPDMKWCYPSMVSYKRALESLEKNYSEKVSKAKRLQKYILQEFEASKMYEKMSLALVSKEDKEVAFGVV